MVKNAEKMSLEVYLSFFHSRELDLLTVNILRQILRMHGCRMSYTQKKGLTAAVSKLDVMDPSRSTLQDNISPSAIISVEDIIVDLNDLNWQECCVTSVQTFNSCGWTLSTLKSYDSESTIKLKKIKSESRSHSRNIDCATSSSSKSEIITQLEKTKFVNCDKPHMAHI